jgi:hypothetical protein
VATDFCLLLGGQEKLRQHLHFVQDCGKLVSFGKQTKISLVAKHVSSPRIFQEQHNIKSFSSTCKASSGIEKLAQVFSIQLKLVRDYNQGTLTEGEGSVQLTSSLR